MFLSVGAQKQARRKIYLRNESLYSGERNTTKVIVKEWDNGIGFFVVSFCNRKNLVLKYIR